MATILRIGKMDVAGQTDTGCVRPHNEDNLAVCKDLGLFVVADGMGGHDCGDKASEMAVQEVEAFCRRRVTEAAEGKRESAWYSDTLRSAFISANHRIHSFSRARIPPMIVGTTGLAAWVLEGRVHIAHVGDSRAYLYRHGKGSRLTRDHSQVQELVDFGHLSEEEAENHILANIITRSLGGEPSVEVDVSVQSLQAGDTLLLCTDGLRRVLDEDEVTSVINDESLDADDTCRELVGRTLQGGAPDNVTVIIVRCLAPENAPKRAKRQKTLPLTPAK